MSQVIIHGSQGLAAWVGREVACSDWLTIDQARIDQFAEVSEDRQWIHIDPQRAQRESPFGTTIAHGHLTLSLLPRFMACCIRVEGVAMRVNYGLNRVRFTAPVHVGARIRARVFLENLKEFAGGVQAHWHVTIEIENNDKPACIVQSVTRYYGSCAASCNE